MYHYVVSHALSSCVDKLMGHLFLVLQFLVGYICYIRITVVRSNNVGIVTSLSVVLMSHECIPVVRK